LAELFVGDLAAVGNWVVANVQSSVPWPLQVETIEFRGRRIFLVPRASITTPDGATHTLCPFAAINLATGENFREGHRLLSHFLSSLSWVGGAGIAVEHWTGGSRAHPLVESQTGGIVTNNFELDYLPDPTNERVRRALAFFREGLSLDRYNVAYAALSFFKILNIIASTGRQQIECINTHLAEFGLTNLSKFEIRRRLDELQASGITDVGEYLYQAGRCAIAHAGLDPTVDPEDPEDIARLTKDLPLIRAMAAHVIEKKLGIKSLQTIWAEHLYELAGFKELLGALITERLKARDATIQSDECRLPNRIRICLKSRKRYSALDNLIVRTVTITEGLLSLFASSESNLIGVDLMLDFPEERMIFDLDKGLRVSDDGSEHSARQIVSVLHFMSDYSGNGKLQIFDADTDSLLSRKDAYIPVNVIPGFAEEHFSKLIEKYQSHAEARAAKSQA